MTRQSFSCNIASAGFWLLTALAMPVIVGGASLIWKNSLWGALAAVFPVLLMAHAILMIRTVKAPDCAVPSPAKVYIYSTDVILPYVWTALCSMSGLMPVYTVFVYLTLPVAIACERTMRKLHNSGEEVTEDLKIRTLNLFCLFSSMFALTLVAGRIF